MKYVSTCGWLLSILRAPRGTGIHPPRPPTCSSVSGDPVCALGPRYSVAYSCLSLRQNGLDDTLEDLLYLVEHGSGIEELLPYLGLDTFASKIRAKIQLKVFLNTSKLDSND